MTHIVDFTRADFQDDYYTSSWSHSTASSQTTIDARWNLLSEFVAEICQGRDDSHGHAHMKAVAETTRFIIQQDFIDESGNLTLDAITAAWLHDVADHKYDHDGTLEQKLDDFGTANIWNAHYYRNNSVLDGGDLVLMDFAPDYHYYTSDVTRMWPVNGKFSDVQKELLGFVLEYRDAVIKVIRPGATVNQLREEAALAMEPVFKRWKFSKPLYEKAARTMVETGGGVFSHPVGLAVHDDGPYHRGPLKPGHVFSIDPQLRVNSENLYIRYEDVVVVTETGCENFTDFLPSKLEDIEKLTGGGGLIQQVPPRWVPGAK